MDKRQVIKIGKKLLGEEQPVYIIFEVASTHEGDWEVVKDYVRSAKEVGADAVKFQLFEADKILNPISRGLRSTYNYFRKTETPRIWFPKLNKLCENVGIDLLCTPFDEDAASFLNNIGIPAIKIASGELTNTPFLSHVAKFGKPVILSTGMGDMEEVGEAVSILRKNGCNQIAILQCTSVYPMPYEDANIAAMNTMQKRFDTVVGYSDNGSKGFLVPLIAVARGASIIEKHATYKKDRGHLDDTFALTIDEFAQLVKRIRDLEKRYAGRFSDAIDELRDAYGDDVDKVIGSSVKKPARDGVLREDGTLMLEADERQWARRGVYPKRKIKKGELITSDNIFVIRPDIGVSIKDISSIIDLVAREDLKARMPILIKKGAVRKFRKSDIKKVYHQKYLKQFSKILEKDALFN